MVTHGEVLRYKIFVKDIHKICTAYGCDYDIESKFNPNLDSMKYMPSGWYDHSYLVTFYLGKFRKQDIIKKETSYDELCHRIEKNCLELIRERAQNNIKLSDEITNS